MTGAKTLRHHRSRATWLRCLLTGRNRRRSFHSLALLSAIHPTPQRGCCRESVRIGSRIAIEQSALVAVPRAYRYPTAYIAAPFTSVARAAINRDERATIRDGPTGGPDSQGRGPGRFCWAIDHALKSLGFATLLRPDRDINRWGHIALELRRCRGMLNPRSGVRPLRRYSGNSHGSHYEYGLARGSGKPAVLIKYPRLGESFVASGMAVSDEQLVRITCRNPRDVRIAFADPRFISFLRGHLPGAGL